MRPNDLSLVESGQREHPDLARRRDTQVIRPERDQTLDKRGGRSEPSIQRRGLLRRHDVSHAGSGTVNFPLGRCRFACRGALLLFAPRAGEGISSILQRRQTLRIQQGGLWPQLRQQPFTRVANATQLCRPGPQTEPIRRVQFQVHGCPVAVGRCRPLFALDRRWLNRRFG